MAGTLTKPLLIQCNWIRSVFLFTCSMTLLESSPSVYSPQSRCRNARTTSLSSFGRAIARALSMTETGPLTPESSLVFLCVKNLESTSISISPRCKRYAARAAPPSTSKELRLTIFNVCLSFRFHKKSEHKVSCRTVPRCISRCISTKRLPMTIGGPFCSNRAMDYSQYTHHASNYEKHVD